MKKGKCLVTYICDGCDNKHKVTYDSWLDAIDADWPNCPACNNVNVCKRSFEDAP